MTSGTFTRVRLFTDVETITLEKWLDADNAGKDDLAKKILDAGLLVEHMIAEIPLEQNLADNSELKQLAENADETFGLIVCFGCNRAFDSPDNKAKTCPNCGAKLPRPDLTPPEIKRTSNNNNPAKEKNSIHDLTKTDHTIQPQKIDSSNEKHSPHSKSNNQTIKKEKKSIKNNGKNNKNSAPSPSNPVLPKDDEEEGWLKLTGQDNPGKHGVKSR